MVWVDGKKELEEECRKDDCEDCRSTEARGKRKSSTILELIKPNRIVREGTATQRNLIPWATEGEER